MGLAGYGGLVIVFGQVWPLLLRLGRWLRFGVLPRPVRPVLGLRPHRAARFGACRWRGNFLLHRGGRCDFFEVSPKVIKAPKAADYHQEYDRNQVKDFAAACFDFGVFFC